MIYNHEQWHHQLWGTRVRPPSPFKACTPILQFLFRYDTSGQWWTGSEHQTAFLFQPQIHSRLGSFNVSLLYSCRQEFMENECEALPGVAYPGVRDNRSTINTKTGYDDDDDRNCWEFCLISWTRTLCPFWSKMLATPLCMNVTRSHTV